MLAFAVVVFASPATVSAAEDPESAYYAKAYAEHYQVPVELVHAIIAQESGWNHRAVSVKGARGLMQLMPPTAASLGVRDCFDKNQNIGGGVRHLRTLLNEFQGDMRLAVAAYYAGEYRVGRRGLSTAIQRSCPTFGKCECAISPSYKFTGKKVRRKVGNEELPVVAIARLGNHIADGGAKIRVQWWNLNLPFHCNGCRPRRCPRSRSETDILTDRSPKASLRPFLRYQSHRIPSRIFV